MRRAREWPALYSRVTPGGTSLLSLPFCRNFGKIARKLVLFCEINHLCSSKVRKCELSQFIVRVYRQLWESWQRRVCCFVTFAFLSFLYFNLNFLLRFSMQTFNSSHVNLVFFFISHFSASFMFSFPANSPHARPLAPPPWKGFRGFLPEKRKEIQFFVSFQLFASREHFVGTCFRDFAKTWKLENLNRPRWATASAHAESSVSADNARNV